MRDISTKTQEAVRAFVEKDLDPSHLVVLLKTGLSVLFGGLLSLMVCGQFGVALSPFANQMTYFMHNSLGPTGCMAACGLTFSVIPVIALRLVTSAMQFKVITTKYVYSWTLYLISFGVILVVNSGGLQISALFVMWATLVVLSFKAMAMLLLSIAPKFPSVGKA